ncbi:MAG: patatin-like phospholipase family protein [Myxococcota bacterium]
MAETPPRTGLVLSGGGARGAYEVGVLQYLYGDLARVLGRPPRFDVVCGTSVGAINACFLATVAAAPDLAPLAAIWEGLDFDRMLKFGPRQMAVLPGKVFGGRALGSPEKAPIRLGGLFYTKHLEDLVQERLDWSGIGRSLASGSLSALAVSATDLANGRTTVFIQTTDAEMPTWSAQAHVDACRATIGADHALASAALPMLFPAVRIDGRYYCDGGLRQNTPLGPALRLGVDRLVVVALRSEGRAARHDPGFWRPGFAGMPYALGKVLDALLLDHLDYDLERLGVFNALFAEGERAFGPSFLDRVNAATSSVRRASYRKVSLCAVRPSEDIGRVAGRHAREGRFGREAKSLAARFLRRTAINSPTEEADLLSYLLFDGDFARELMALGRRDAAAKRDELLALLGE